MEPKVGPKLHPEFSRTVGLDLLGVGKTMTFAALVLDQGVGSVCARLRGKLWGERPMTAMKAMKARKGKRANCCLRCGPLIKGGCCRPGVLKEASAVRAQIGLLSGLTARKPFRFAILN